MQQILRPNIYWLFIFLPLAIVFESVHASAPLIFFSAALAIIPIARLISKSTEHLASYTGDTIGGLLNATFGNLPELMIATIALSAGLHQLVLASLAGAILANLLLALGVSFLVGGIKYHNQDYNPFSVRLYSSMMMIAVLSLTVPSSFHRVFGQSGPTAHQNSLNIAIAILLLIGYALYLVFMLRTHPDLFKSQNSGAVEEEHEHWPLPRALTGLVGASALAAYSSEILVGAAEQTGQILGMTEVFIGVILLAIVGGAAESISAIVMASKNRMDLCLGIALGSSIQIALFVAPLLVLLSLFVGPGQMNLAFSGPLLGSLFLGVIIASMISGDGRSNWYKGVQLIMVYSIIAMMFYFMPQTS